MSSKPPRFTLVNVADRRTYWVGGQCQAVIVGGADTGGRYALSHSTIAVGGGAAEHAHGREAEAFYVLSGRLAFSVAGETRILVPGTFLHSNQGMPMASWPWVPIRPKS
jgi:quercetin dioxygenase-like cupin family protein